MERKARYRTSFGSRSDLGQAAQQRYLNVWPLCSACECICSAVAECLARPSVNAIIPNWLLLAPHASLTFGLQVPMFSLNRRAGLRRFPLHQLDSNFRDPMAHQHLCSFSWPRDHWFGTTSAAFANKCKLRRGPRRF